MTERPAHLDHLLEFVTEGLAAVDPLEPHNSAALDTLADAFYDDDPAPSPASAYTAAKYVLAQHARELARLLMDCKEPTNVEPRIWAAYQLKQYATGLDGQTRTP